MLQHEWTRPRLRPATRAAAWALVAAVALQVFFAGLAVTGDPTWWPVHAVFGHLVTYVALAAAVLAWLAGAPGRIRTMAWIAFGLVFAQSVFIHLPTAWLRAIHPVNALAVFALALFAALASTRRVAPA